MNVDLKNYSEIIREGKNGKQNLSIFIVVIWKCVFAIKMIYTEYKCFCA